MAKQSDQYSSFTEALWIQGFEYSSKTTEVQVLKCELKKNGGYDDLCNV